MKNLITILTLFISASVVAQSPWTKKKKEGYFQLSYSTISNYDELFGNPDYPIDRKITDNTVQLYGEYGITDKTTLFGNIPLKMLKSGDLVNKNISRTPITSEGTETSLGNIQVGIKHQFYNKKWIVSGQLGIEANTSSFEKASGLRTGYDAWTFTPLILAGRGFNNWYIQAFTGFDIRTNDYSSNYKLGGEIGYKALDWLWIAGFLDGVLSLTNGDIILPATNRATGLYVNNQQYAGFGLKFIGQINKNLGANIGLGGAFAARNLAKAPAFNVGVYYKL
ncbi:conserved exported hypothetical protein [Tenacibaculum maritimum]|uniref:hypothetical protein n=1 Tax=Tenacibaculum maritimum TaxID=107401 RepID=UPI0012E438C3|nr:hypothetical protein [Tenacibaculum maritimum]CAA0161694.1 conserved exported hypothetical protein [Tenacibaculum maritimum]CAA0210366.1 conserved exported hypothetical protein [Tenacibaculum maritimum]CAA0232281.1 conserved exported hypothetical protein [Tenacibaculum maritimum]